MTGQGRNRIRTWRKIRRTSVSNISKFKSEIRKDQKNLEKRVQEREEQVSEQLKEIRKNIGEICEREGWTREQFDEVRKNIREICEREGWTRDQFEEVRKNIGEICEREEWTRGKFKEHKRLIERIEEMVQSNDFDSEDMLKHFYRKKSFAQSGEDVIAAYIINFLNIPFWEVTYLDLGANHAVELSNTYLFYRAGARGVLVEANPELIPELRRERSKDTILNKAVTLKQDEIVTFYILNGDGLSTVSKESADEALAANPTLSIKAQYEIPTITIDTILKDYFPKGLTILSIDLEGMEEAILKEIHFEEYRPLIIILENIPYHPYLVIGSKEDKAGEELRENGYIEYAFTGINSIYVDSRQIEKFNQDLLDHLKAENKKKAEE